MYTDWKIINFPEEILHQYIFRSVLFLQKFFLYRNDEFKITSKMNKAGMFVGRS